MKKKVFISYSHKDESHREDFGEHLSMMQRNNIIDYWHDRKITPGDDWKNKIDENLESADIIIFLVSSSFLASDYCYDVEVKRAIERHKEGSAKIISIIVRACDWEECEFSQFQAVPKDALPITKWEDKDTAWLDAVKGIKTHIQEFYPAVVQAPEDSNDEPVLTNNIMEWLDDTEIVLTHRKVNRLKLNDIYVIPDIELESSSNLVTIKSSSFILKKMSRFLVSGEEQQGKSSFLKYIYKELLKLKYFPVYIDASKVKKSDADLVISKQLEEQYLNLDIDFFKNSNKGVVLLDNIDDIGLNTKFTRVFLDKINLICSVSCITCHSSYRYVYGDIPALDEYERVEMLGLGNKKREELVQKWISLGVEESIDDYDLYSECDELKSRLNAVIKKNIVPPKPIYILMLLQMFEAHVQLKMDMTSYGHCYQQLIYQSFDNALIPKNEFDRYLNVLTEFSWLIFKKKKEPNQNEVEEFFDSYNKKYLPVDEQMVLNKLTKHSILNFNGVSYSFKYPYIYYFFVGKKVADSYRDSEETKGMVAHLLSELHREDYANILIFITHHTKDSWVLDEIKKVLSSLFDEYSEATLNKKQLAFMDDFMKKIPDLILEQREIQKERDRQNERLDHIERRSEVDDFKDKNTDEHSAPLDILANINKTFKGMEISGQIIRNRHASLTRDSMEELARTGACSGLRFLEYFIKISDVAKKEIIKLISNHLAESPDISDKEIEKQAEDTYLHLTYGVISGLTRKIASSIGSKEALEVYIEMESNIGTPAVNLIRQAIELHFKKSLDIDQISDCVKQLRDNPVCLRILKEMVIQHIYMFPVTFRQKQQLSTLLNLPVQGQRLMDMNKIGKG